MKFKKGKRVPLNEVDAAIAQITPGAVGGSILDIGYVSANTIPLCLSNTVQIHFGSALVLVPQ